MEKFSFLYPFPGGNSLRWKKLFLGRLDNNRGQTLVTWLLLLSLILLVTISFGSALTLIQDRMHVMSVCRMESLKTQSEVEPLIKKLFALNPQARLLRVLMVAAKARLAAAIAHFNFAMAAHARLDIARIRQQQNILDATQRMLVRLANIKLHTGTFATYMKLNSSFKEISEKNKQWAQTTFTLLNPRVPKLAVKREDSNLAPAYLPRDNFEKLQTTTQSWIQRYEIKGTLKINHSSQSQCNSTLEENSWVPKIRRDKLSLR